MCFGFWLCSFIIKLYSQKDIFKYIKRKQGKIFITFCDHLKVLKFEKTKLDIEYIKLCGTNIYYQLLQQCGYQYKPRATN